MPTADQIIDAILAREGGTFTDDANDSGGATRWGITQKTLSGYLGRPASVVEVAALTRAEAAAIYTAKYWKDPGFEQIAEISAALADELCDTGVNMGTAVSSVFLQRALNALNQGGTLYADIQPDGDCGPATLAALTKFLALRGPAGVQVLLKALNCLQGERYIWLAEKRQQNESFLFGWLQQRVSI
jgi:lysozyme family protein